MMKLELRERQGMRVLPQMYAGQHILALSGISLEHYLDRLAQQNACIKVTGRGDLCDRRVSADLKAVKRSYGYVVKVINPFTLDDFVDNTVSRASYDVAMRLRRALEFRNHTLQRVAQVLVDRQLSFIEQGVAGLNPLGLREVAQEVGLSIASVSRAIKDKKILINHEFFVLKGFLSYGVSTGHGLVTQAYIKQQIIDIKEQLGQIKISDRQMTELLAQRDLRISRRTVAKYRLQIYNENNGCTD
jgi:DNA-directed RNA polymerase specialized sigma54-like protein